MAHLPPSTTARLSDRDYIQGNVQSVSRTGCRRTAVHVLSDAWTHFSLSISSHLRRPAPCGEHGPPCSFELPISPVSFHVRVHRHRHYRHPRPDLPCLSPQLVSSPLPKIPTEDHLVPLLPTHWVVGKGDRIHPAPAWLI